MATARVGGWVIAFGLYGALAIWLFCFPPSISHDDAYFFLQGIERFSILEFRPHFPGYPGYILLGKLLLSFGLSPLNALSLLSNSAALAIAPLACLCVDKNRIAVFLFALSIPLLPYLGLSMMSDGTGIAFFLAALWQYKKGNLIISGLLLGWALACRPSFVVFAATFIIGIFITERHKTAKLVLSCATLCLIIVTGLLFLERQPLIWEGWRFIEGHFLLWGNTQLSVNNPSWINSITNIKGGASYYALILILGLVVNIYHHHKHALFYILLGGWGWTLLFQNPENLRHLALPLLLSAIFLAQTATVANRTILYSLIAIHLMISNQTIWFNPQNAPLEQVRQYLLQKGVDKILTNHGVFYLRDRLPNAHVFDHYYPYQLDLPFWRVSTTAGSSTSETIIFPARFLGEKSFLLFKNE